MSARFNLQIGPLAYDSSCWLNAIYKIAPQLVLKGVSVKMRRTFGAVWPKLLSFQDFCIKNAKN